MKDNEKIVLHNVGYRILGSALWTSITLTFSLLCETLLTICDIQNEEVSLRFQESELY